MSVADPYIAILTVAYNFTFAVVVTAIRLVWWPINHLLHALVIILSPFWNLINFLLLPFIRFGQGIISILAIPFSVKWLERLETMYIFVGTAGLVGCITGAVVFLIFKFISSTLKIDSPIVPVSNDSGRTAAEYRAAKNMKKVGSAERSLAPPTVVLKKAPGSRRRGLLSQAIIEEEDSDF